MMACGFGAGLVPVAPGTAGTAVGAGWYLLLERLPITWYLGIVTFLFCLGIGLTGAASRQLGVHDHPAIVWDEIVGFLITMAGVPWNPGSFILGFVLFRILDITKPWPIQYIDRRVEGGLGIMLDDLLAGIYAWALLQFITSGLKIIDG